MTVRPFRLYGVSRRRALQAGFNEAASSWSRKWASSRKAVFDEFRSLAMDDLDMDEWACVGVEGNGRIYWRASDEAYAITAIALGGYDDDTLPDSDLTITPLVKIWVDRAVANMLGQAVSEITGSDRSEAEVRYGDLPRDRLCLPGSGAMCTRMAFGRAAFMMVMDGDTVGECLGPTVNRENVSLPTDLDSLGDSLGRVRIELCAELSAVAGLRSRELLSLDTGDVVVFEHGLNAPVSLRLDSGALLGAGYLGQFNGYKALRMTRS